MPATYTWVYTGPGLGAYNVPGNWTGGPANTFPGTSDSIDLPDGTGGIDLTGLGSCAGITTSFGSNHVIKGSLTVNGSARIWKCAWDIAGHLSVSGDVNLSSTTFIDSTAGNDGIAFCTDGTSKYCIVGSANEVYLAFGEALKNYGAMRLNATASIVTYDNSTPNLFRNEGTLKQEHRSELLMPVANYGIIWLGEPTSVPTRTGWIKNFGTVIVTKGADATVGGPGANAIPTGDLFVPQADFVNYPSGTNGSTHPGRLYIYGGGKLTCSHGVFSSGTGTGIGSIRDYGTGDQWTTIVGNVAIYNSSFVADYKWGSGTGGDPFVVDGSGSAEIHWNVVGTLTTEGATAIGFNYDSSITFGGVNLLMCTTIQFSDPCVLLCTKIVNQNPPNNNSWKVINATTVVHNGSATLGSPGSPFAGTWEDTTNKDFYVFTTGWQIPNPGNE